MGNIACRVGQFSFPGMQVEKSKPIGTTWRYKGL